MWAAGEQVVCGIDEVGRGAWAGPVTVAAVVPAPEHLRGVRDSKQLDRAHRELAATAVRGWAVAIGVGHASHEECDELGMTAALRAAGLRALAQLDDQGYRPDRVVLDGNHDYLGLGSRVTTVIKGDATCLAVAAASCVAKVTRDRMMIAEAEHFRRTASSRTWATRRRCTRPRSGATVRARSTGARGSSWTTCAGPVFPRRRDGCSHSNRPRSEDVTMDVDLPEVHARSLDATRVFVAGVADRQLGDASVCNDWTVRELVNHIVSGNYWAEALAAARPSRRSVIGSMATSSATIRSACTTGRRPPPRRHSAPGAMDAPCAVSYGPVPGSIYCGHRFMDVLIHGWDVAKSTGQGTELHPDLVEACWAVLEPQLDLLVGQRHVRGSGAGGRRRRCPDPAPRGARPSRVSR